MSVLPKLVGEHPVYPDHGMFLLECESLEAIDSDFELDATHFVAFLITDFSVLTRDEIQAAAADLIQLGCRYLCAWGPSCREAHLAFDLACVEFHGGNYEDGVIFTDDYSRCSDLSESIWTTLHVAHPEESYANETLATVAICVNDSVSARLVESKFRNQQLSE